MHLDQEFDCSINDLFAGRLGGNTPNYIIAIELVWRNHHLDVDILRIDGLRIVGGGLGRGQLRSNLGSSSDSRFNLSFWSAWTIVDRVHFLLRTVALRFGEAVGRVGGTRLVVEACELLVRLVTRTIGDIILLDGDLATCDRGGGPTSFGLSFRLKMFSVIHGSLIRQAVDLA